MLVSLQLISSLETAVVVVCTIITGIFVREFNATRTISDIELNNQTQSSTASGNPGSMKYSNSKRWLCFEMGMSNDTLLEVIQSLNQQKSNMSTQLIKVTADLVEEKTKVFRCIFGLHICLCFFV
jgi:hypothetical protein